MAVIDHRHEVDALDLAVSGVIVVPANNVVLISGRLLITPV